MKDGHMKVNWRMEDQEREEQEVNVAQTMTLIQKRNQKCILMMLLSFVNALYHECVLLIL